MNSLGGVALKDDTRILFVDLSKRYGGASTRALLLAKNLSPMFAAIAGLHESPVLRIARTWGIPVFPVARSRMDPLITFRLAHVIDRENISIIDSQNIQSKFWGSAVTAMKHVAFVSTLNSSYRSEFGTSMKGRLYSYLDHLTNVNVHQYVAVSEAIKDELLQAGIRAEQVDVVKNSVAEPSGVQADARDVRDRLGVPLEAFLCVSVGRLVWAKGYEDLIQAFHGVVEQVPNAYAVIAGDGELRPALMSLIERLNLNGRVILLGHQSADEVQNILRAGDLYLMPSRSEGIPYALLEAAVTGIPIVASDCGGIPEVVTHNVSAWLVPVGDIAGLAEAIVDLSCNPDKARKFGRQARERVLAEYGIQRQVREVKQAYARALRHAGL